MQTSSIWKKVKSGLIVGIGYMLSPLSWWNDLFFNLPIAYLFGYSVSWAKPDWFLPATLVGYWLSNVLGMCMMQFGATDLLFQDRPRQPRKDLLIGLGTSTIYTLAVVALIHFHVLETPTFLASR